MSTAAVMVVDPSGVLGSTGPDVVLPWASVTKLVTALTVLVAVDRGELGLDDAAGPDGSTVRHLLAHTSGLPPEMGPPVAAPGRRRVYSNAGFESLAAHLAERTSTPFGDRLSADVLGPLGMARTELVGSPAHGIRGPVSDLARLGAELLIPTLAPTLLPPATGVVFAGLDGILPGYGRQTPNDWGLGFEIRGRKSPHWTGTQNSPETFGHFGRSGTFLWVDPSEGLACACLTDRDFDEEWTTVWPVLSDAVLAEVV